MPPHNTLPLTASLLLAATLSPLSACQKPNAAHSDPQPTTAAATSAPHTSAQADASAPHTSAQADASAPSANTPSTSAPSTSAPPSSSPASPAFNEPARPPTLQPGTDAQRTLLDDADASISQGDLDMAALHLLSLSETPEFSQERLAGLLLLAELYRAEALTEPTPNAKQDPKTLQEKKRKKALKLLLDQEFKFPPTVEFYTSLADIYQDLLLLPEATRALQRAALIDPHRLNLIARLTYFSLSQGDAAVTSQIVQQYQQTRDQIAAILSTPQTPPEHILALISTIDQVRDPALTPALSTLLSHPDARVIAATLQTMLQVNASDASDAVRAAATTQQDPEIAEVFRQVADMLQKNPSQTPSGVWLMPPAKP
jgi:hypothetical protein